jgi:hypothetical protein
MRLKTILICSAMIASPAFATEGMTCAPPGKDWPLVGLTIGHAAEPGVANAVLVDDKGEVTVEVSQSFIDDDKVWVNLGDEGLMNLVAKLRAEGPPGKIYGTLSYKGKTYKVRCSSDEEEAEDEPERGR